MAHYCLIIIIMVWHVEPSPTITDLSICVVASPLQHMLLAVAAFRGVQTYEKIRADRPEPSSVRKKIYFLGCGWGMLRKWCGNCIKGYQRSSICLHFNHQKQVLHPWSQPHPGGGLAFTSSILQLLLPFEAVGSGWRNKTPYIAMMSRLGIGGNGLQDVHADASRGRKHPQTNAICFGRTMVPRWGIFGPCEVAANHCYTVQCCAILCKSKCCWHLPTRYRIWDHTGPVLGSWYKIGEVLASGNPCPSAQSCRKLQVWHLQSLHTSTPFILQQPLQFLAIILAIQKGSASKFDWARARSLGEGIF